MIILYYLIWMRVVYNHHFSGVYSNNYHFYYIINYFVKRVTKTRTRPTHKGYRDACNLLMHVNMARGCILYRVYRTLLESNRSTKRLNTGEKLNFCKSGALFFDTVQRFIHEQPKNGMDFYLYYKNKIY